MTTHEIIDYIAGYYNLDNRSTDAPKIMCVYNGPDGKHCAFALMCIDSTLLEEGKNASAILRLNSDSILKPEFRGYSPEFYDDVQRLHDCSENWTKTGLSPEGEDKVAALKERYP